MGKKPIKLPSPAMGVAFVALLAALTGTAVALPGSNNVTSGDIKRGAVGTSDIKNNAVRSGDIRNSTVRSGDVRNNTLTGNDVNEGSLGTVPRANAANSANSAATAGTASLAGEAVPLKRWYVTLDEGDEADVLSFGGIVINASCDAAAANTELNYTVDGPSGFAAAGDDDDGADGGPVTIENPGATDAAGGDPDIQTSGYDATFEAFVPGIGLNGAAASWADGDSETCVAWGYAIRG